MPRRPETSEYAPYHGGYVSLVPDGDIVSILETQIAATRARLARLSDQAAASSYAPGKWTIKDVVGHLIDAERVFSYRALRFSRNDPTPLPSFPHDEYVRTAGANARPLADLLDELVAVRGATVALFRSFSPEMFDRTGTASDHRLTVRALAYITAGHERHHVGILEDAGVIGDAPTAT